MPAIQNLHLPTYISAAFTKVVNPKLSGWLQQVSQAKNKRGLDRKLSVSVLSIQTERSAVFTFGSNFTVSVLIIRFPRQSLGSCNKSWKKHHLQSRELKNGAIFLLKQRVYFQTCTRPEVLTCFHLTNSFGEENFIWLPSKNKVCIFSDTQIVLSNYNIQFFYQPLVFRRQPAEFFFSSKVIEMKAGQNIMYTKTSKQVCLLLC